MSNRVSSLSVGLAFTGAVVGAGFISGQELVQFFLRFGFMGFMGWVLVGLATIFGGGMMLTSFSEKKYASFAEFCDSYFGSLSWLIILVSNAYLFGGLIIMVAGSGNLLSDTLKIPNYVSVLSISALLCVVVMGGTKRFLNLNRVLIPVLVGITLLVAGKSLSIHGLDNTFDVSKTFEIKNPSPLLPNWLVSVFLYLGYNIIGALVGFINIAKESDVEESRKGGLIGGAIVAILGAIMLITLWFAYPTWKGTELPFVSVVDEQSTILQLMFAPTMLIAMFTVATSYALGISKFLSVKYNKDFTRMVTLVFLVVIPVSLLGFSRLLGLIYPIFGIAAVVMFLYFVVLNTEKLFPKSETAKL